MDFHEGGQAEERGFAETGPHVRVAPARGAGAHATTTCASPSPSPSPSSAGDDSAIQYDYDDAGGDRILRLRPTREQWQDLPA
ncbi:hypothetical protein E4U41_004996, partial [Claviceps citrina]